MSDVEGIPASPPAVVSDAASEAALRAGDEAAARVAAAGPTGTFMLAGIATAIVVAIYFLFYFFIYLPRGAVQ